MATKQGKKDKSRDKVAQIAAEAVERVENVVNMDEDIIVTIEELPPGSDSRYTSVASQRALNPTVPVDGLFDLAALPVTFMRVSMEMWGVLMGSMFDYQKNVMGQTKELVS